MTVDVDGTDGYFGLDNHVGVGFHLSRWVELFAEYRFIYVFSPYEDEIEAGAVTHSVVGGVGFHF